MLDFLEHPVVLYSFLRSYIQWRKSSLVLNEIESNAFAAAAEFGGVNISQIEALIEEWRIDFRKLFDPQNPEHFYPTCPNLASIFANIRDQCTRKYVYHAVSRFLKPGSFYLDFGCGAATISLHFANRINCAFLVDVDNYVAEYVRWRLRRSNLKQYQFLTPDEFNSVPEEKVEFCLCIDVLEHLKNPSQVMSQISQKLKTGGILVLQAPWGGRPDHLPISPIDWNTNGGADELAKSYRQIETMVPFIVPLSGIFQKL
jgi:SAM-dependent methyltransferase